MLRILHFGSLKSINPGVKTQLDIEITAARRLNINHTVVFFSNDEPCREYMKKPDYLASKLLKVLPLKLQNYLNLRIHAYSWLNRNQNKFDIIVVRYPLGDPIFPIYARKLKPFFSIHHTKELNEIRSRSALIFKIQLFLEKIQFRLISEKILAFIGVTGEIANYENSRLKSRKNTFVYPNGVTETNREPEDNRGGKAKLCFICNKETPWHGLPKVYSQLLSCQREDFELYIVGHVDPAPEIEGDSRVIFTGYLSNTDLEKLLIDIDLSIGPFSLDLLNLEEACPLKTRTSLQFGVPVLADYRDPCFNDDFPFFLQSNFDLTEAIEFALKLRNIPKHEISKISQKSISKEHLLAELTSSLAEIHSYQK